MYSDIPIWLALAFLAVGLYVLAWSADRFVGGAEAVSRALGVSPFIIGMVIVGFGTSAPELAVSALSGMAGHSNLSLGNAYGSNIFNILLILGGAAIIHPLSFEGITYVDLGALIISALVLLTSSYVGKKNMLDKVDGALFLLLFAGYMSYLIINL